MNIDKITISIDNISMTIYPKLKEVKVGDNTINIEEETIRELLHAIVFWKHEYYDGSYYDGIKFEVSVFSGDKVDTYRGTRKVPENFIQFSELVRSIYDRAVN